MSSNSEMFSLTTDMRNLSSMNNAVSRLEYDEITPLRDISGTSFPNGQIEYRWSVAGNKWWVPARSYFRVRLDIKNGAGAQPLAGDDIAPNMGLCANLFQSAEFLINGKVVSRIADFMPQIDTLEHRLGKSKAMLDGVDNSLNMWAEDYQKRQSIICSDVKYGKGSKSAYGVESLGRLGLGFDGQNTFAIDANGVITFAAGGGAVPPDTKTIFRAGDIFKCSLGEGIVASTPTALTVNLTRGIGVVATAADPFYRIRGATTVNSSRNANVMELIWQPPLSIFKLPHALPCGDYTIRLNPQTTANYQLYPVESESKALAANTDVKLNVDTIYFYCNTLVGERVDNLTYLLDLDSTSCQLKNITSNALTQRDFDVSPSTSALTVAYQDTRRGTDTRFSASKFKVSNAAVANRSEELKLNRLYVSYAGVQMPSPDADPEFKAGTDRTTQRYIESLINSGNYGTSGSSETIQDYHNRGSYYHFEWPRDGTDRSTRVVVYNQFQGDGGADVSNMNVLLFCHHKQVARVQVANGRVVDVQVEDQ